jgi:hypothetical protein
MDTDGYTTPPPQGNDGIYSPTPHTTKTHHGTNTGSGGYGGTSSGCGGYGHPGCETPTPTASVAVPTTAPPVSLPVTSTPAGGHLGIIVAVGATATLVGLGMLRSTARRRTWLAGYKAQHRPVA